MFVATAHITTRVGNPAKKGESGVRLHLPISISSVSLCWAFTVCLLSFVVVVVVVIVEYKLKHFIKENVTTIAIPFNPTPPFISTLQT